MSPLPCRLCGRPFYPGPHLEETDAHPCCVTNEEESPGGRCQPCLISEGLNKKWKRWNARWRGVSDLR